MSVESRTEVQTSEILQDTMPSSTPLDTDGETLTHDSAPFTLAKIYRWLVAISKSVLGEATRRNGSKRIQGLEQVITGKITSANTAVTGASTLFLTELYVGAFIAGTAGEYREVAAIASNVSLTLVTAFSSDIGSAQNFTRLQMLSERIDGLEVYQNSAINGDLHGWISGVSFSTPASDSQLADQFYAHYDGTIGTFTVTQNLFTLGQTDVPGEPQYYLRWNHTVAGSTQTVKQLRYKISGVRSFAGQTMQVTFYAKMGSGADISVGATQAFGSGGSPSSDVVVTAKTRSLLTAFSRFTVTLAVPSISGKIIGSNNDDALYINFNLPLNAASDFYLSNLAVYASTAELPFRKSSIVQNIINYFTSSAAADSTGSNIASSDILPGSSYGKQAFTLTVSPTKATSIIIVDWQLNLSHSNSSGNAMITSLFKDAGATAIAATIDTNDNGSVGGVTVRGSYQEVAGSTAPRVYALRYGSNAGTCYLNGYTARQLGGALISWMRITEQVQ